MGKVILDLAMSLDGFIEGPKGQPERLHDWMFPASGNVNAASAKVIEDGINRFGAIVMGRRAYDLGDAYDGYVDNPYQVVHFVLTHEAPIRKAKGETEFVFVTDGIESALAQAQTAAGDKDIAIGGGADIAQQFLRAGLVDEIKIDLVPVLFGDGTRLFEHIGDVPLELEITQVIEAPGVTHLRYRVTK